MLKKQFIHTDQFIRLSLQFFVRKYWSGSKFNISDATFGHRFQNL